MPLATIGLFRFQGQTSTPTDHGPEAASQTYVAGAPVVRDSAGRIAEGGTDPTGIAGFAQHAGANTTAGADTAFFTSANPDVEFVGSVDDGSDEGNGTSALTQVGQRYGLTQTSLTGNDANKWYVDTNKTDIAVQRVEVTGLVDAAATTQGRVRFKVL